MSASAFEVTCSVCGTPFVPPKGSTRYFCPQCGLQMSQAPATLTPEQAQAQAMQAIEQAARASELATRAAQIAQSANGRAQSVEEANQAVHEAMEAVRMAQAAQHAQEQHTRQQAKQMAQEAAERERAAREAEARRRAKAEEAAQAEAAARKEEKSAEQATTRQRPVEYRRNATVRHTNGCGLFVVTIPTNWNIQQTFLRQQSARPYNPQVTFTNNEGATITLRQDDAGTRLSEGMRALMSTYGSAISHADRTNYASMPNPRKLADSHVLDLTKRTGATDLYLLRDLASPRLAERQQEALRHFKEMGRVVGNTLVKDPFAAEVVRIYEFVMNGTLTNAAVYVRLYATKDASGVENMSPVGLMFNAGSALSGLFSKRKGTQQQAQRPQQTQTTGDGSPWCTPDYDSYVRGGTIYWDAHGLATLVAPAAEFEKCLNEAFLPLVGSYEVHPDVTGLAANDARQQAAQMQQATNQQVAAMNMQTQASLAAARQVQAAADARFESWQRNSDAHHAAFRERTNAQFNTGGTGGGVADFSEAIRGVNTFRTSDGREVELDVSADRAYENQAGDVIGGSGGFEPGADWTEIPRV